MLWKALDLGYPMTTRYADKSFSTDQLKTKISSFGTYWSLGPMGTESSFELIYQNLNLILYEQKFFKFLTDSDWLK